MYKRCFVAITVVMIVLNIGECAYQRCPQINTCLSESTINCISNTSVINDPRRLCCPGLDCVPIEIPQTDTQDALSTTICASSSEYITQESAPSRSISENKAEQPRKSHPSKIPKPIQNLKVPSSPPIMANAWKASTVYYNMSDGSTGWGSFYYDVSMQALRTDFYPVCPFLQLYQAGVDANYVPCSVVFYEGFNYFIYPEQQTCCKYKFPVWYPDWLCSGNATFGGYVNLDGIATELWEVQWLSDYTGIGPVLNIRNMYVESGTGIPVRIREDLDTGFLDFHDYVEGSLNTTIFTDVIDLFQCHYGHNSQNNDKTCTKYNSQNLRRTWPCDNPTCSN